MSITYENFIDELGSDNCIVDFWADWCSPCKMFSPLFDSAKTRYEDIKFLKIDVMENPELADSLGVTSIPTIHFYSNGILVDEMVGAPTAARFEDFIKNNK